MMAREPLSSAILLGRELGTGMVLFYQVVAERFGLTIMDLRCLDMLDRMGPLTAGQLAEQLRLTGGAITGMIDRMEAAGVVQRERDATDRRRVHIKPTPNEEQTNQIKPIYASLRQALHEELAERYSPEALAAIEDFLRRTIQVLQQQTQQLSQETAK